MNIQIMGVPEEEEKREKYRKLIKEIMAKNFPNLGRDMYTQIHKAQKIPSKINPNNIPKYIIIKLSKVREEENAESSKRKETHHIQWNLHKVMSRHLHRKLADQEGEVE